MNKNTSSEPEFIVQADSDSDSTALLAGFSEIGLAGLTAADYLVDQLELEVCGHVETPDLPTITPFDEGTPRHPIRLFSRPDVDVTVLVAEPVLPVFSSRSFAGTLQTWTKQANIGEIAIVSGVPIDHAPDDHRTFYVATTDYQDRRLADADLPAMGKGFLDGVSGSLLAAGIDTPLAVGVFVTPAHLQTPDVDAALRLVETTSEVYDLNVDTGPLEEFAAAVQRHYQELSQRLEETEDEFLPEDRMYM